jgi:glycosyltransferase involved in cell wall biosynthesis
MVSALIESKRVLDGIRSVARQADAYLVVAGDGPLRQQVSALGRQLLPNRFSLLSLAADEMPELYRTADVFLHLSLLESFGNVFLEAWASGIPIVAHDSDRLRWILGRRHFLCNSENPIDLDAALARALSADRTGLRDGVEQYSWSNIAAGYRTFIEDTVLRR